MKRILLIVAAVTLVVAVVVVWVYLFKYGKPDSVGGVFAQFGLSGDETGVPPIETEPPQETPEIPKEVSKTSNLRQLTTKPTGGAVVLGPSVRYMEQGTGHIYDIDLTSTNVTLMNGKTIPGARKATFSTDGHFVAIEFAQAGGTKTVLRNLTDTNTSEIGLPINAGSISFVGSSTLHYFVGTPEKGIGYRYDFITKKTTLLFQIPLRDVRVLWGNPNYVYTTPTAFQAGSIYQVQNNKLTYLAPSATGLMALRSSQDLLLTQVEDEIWRTFVLSSSGDQKSLPALLIPEKCISFDSYFYCGIPAQTTNQMLFPENWYKGTASFSDDLWRIDPKNLTAERLSRMEDESQRFIDIFAIGVDVLGKNIWFINKNDNTLWLYKLENSATDASSGAEDTL